jgi:hypothetical protein
MPSLRQAFLPMALLSELMDFPILILWLLPTQMILIPARRILSP